MFPLLDPIIFKISGTASVVESLLFFATLLANLKRELYVSKSPILTGVAGLQNTISKFSKRALTKFLKDALKLTENYQEIISNGVPNRDLQTYKF